MTFYSGSEKKAFPFRVQENVHFDILKMAT